MDTTAYRDRWMRLLNERSAWERRVRQVAMDAARRSALRLVTDALTQTMTDVHRLAAEAAKLPDRPSTEEVEHVRSLAMAFHGRDLRTCPDVAALEEIRSRADVAVQDALGTAAHWFNVCQRIRREWLDSAEARQAFRDAGWTPPALIPGIRDEHGEPIERPC